MQSQHMRRLAAGISTSAIALALVVAMPAQAQSSNSTLQGHVEGAASGTEVVAVDQHTGQRLTGHVNADGDYVILGVRPSTYEVTVQGFGPQTTTVLVGDTSTVDFGDSGTIVVTGAGAIREVRTETVSTNVTTAQIENLPQNSRNFLSFAILAPGVNVAPGGTAQLQAGATSSSNTNVLLDGLSLKNPINHGGIFGQNFGIGNPFPQIAIQEYRIETQNFGAETGQVGSALITAVTKTGGDEFHGSAFVEYQPNSFITQPYFDQLRNVPKPTYRRYQFGGDIGGPIIPGVLSFYFAGEGTSQRLPGSTGTLSPVVGGYPASVVSAINGVARNFDFHQGLYFGKLTWFASGDDTVNLEAFVRRENNLADIDSNAAPTHGRTILTHQNRYQLNWTHSGDDFLNVFNFAYDRSEQSTPSVGTGAEFVLSNGTGFSEDARLGSHFFEQGDIATSYTLRDDLTLTRGDHTIKAGFQIARLDLSRTVNNSFRGRYFFTNPGSTGTFDPATSFAYAARINTLVAPTLSARDVQTGLYIQDEWKPDEHWTFNLGLRWDIESNSNNNNYITPPRIAAALRAYPGWRARGINPEDYISTGRNRSPQADAFQPRFGFSYDVHGDRQTVLFGGAGRYYDRSLFIAGAIEQLTNADNIQTVFFCPGGGASMGNGRGTDAANCTQLTAALRNPDNLRAFAASNGNAGGNIFVLNNDTPLPYSDQFDIGIRQRFGSIQTSLTLAHIRSHNIFQFVRANFYENGWYSRRVTRDGAGNVTGCTDGGDAWIQDFTPGSLRNGDGSAVSTAICAAQNGQVAGFSGKLDRGVSDGRATYTAIYLTVEKPFTENATWGFSSALTIQRARSNVAQELNNDEFFNGASQDAYGTNPVNGLESWRFVTSGNYRAPWGITLSGTLVLSSGPSFGNVRGGGAAPGGGAPDGACCYGNFGGPLNPERFVAYRRLDLRLAKTFELPFGGGQEVTIDFEAFNVFNWLNRNYSSWGAGAAWGTGPGNPPLIEDSQVGNDARSFQVGLRFEF
ncbi:MAG: TonB-dependent receptor [Sphingopyxis sp.]